MKKKKESKQDVIVPDAFVLKGWAFNGFHALPKHEAQRLYTGLIKYGNSCGCDEGAIGVILSTCLYLLIGFCLPFLQTEPVTATWQMGVMTAVVGGILGKGFGLWWANLRFKGLKRELNALVNNQTQTAGSTASEINRIGGISNG